MVTKLINRLKDQNTFVLFLLFFCIDIIYTFGASFIVYQINPSLLNVFQGLSTAELVFLAVVIAPLIESLIFQLALIELLLKFFKKRYTLVVCVSGGLFAISHYYNLTYILVIFFLGLLYALYYLIVKEKTSSKRSAYWALVLLHALSNLMSFIPVFE